MKNVFEMQFQKEFKSITISRTSGMNTKFLMTLSSYKFDIGIGQRNEIQYNIDNKNISMLKV